MRRLSATAGVTAVTLTVAALGVTAVLSSSSADAAALPAPPVSLAGNGVVVDVPVHPAQLLHDARTALRVTRQVLKKFPKLKILAISPRRGGGFTVRVLISPRQTGTVTVDRNFHVGALVPTTWRSAVQSLSAGAAGK